MLEAIIPTIMEALLHKLAEERLRDSEARFTAFMNSTPLIALIKDEEGRHVFMNKTWEKLYGRKIRNALGKKNLDLLSEEDAKRMDEAHQRVLATGKPYEETVPISNGREQRYWRIIRFPFHSISGKAYTGCIGIDITKEKKAREDLVYSESLLRDVMEGMNSPVFLKDLMGRFIMGNSALGEAMGMPLARLLGKTDLEIYKDKEKARNIMENDRRVIASGAVRSFEESVPTPDGIRTYFSTKTPWRNSWGQVTGIIGVAPGYHRAQGDGDRAGTAGGGPQTEKQADHGFFHQYIP